MSNRWRIRKDKGFGFDLPAIAEELARIERLGIDPYRDICSWLEVDDKGKRAVLDDLTTAGFVLPSRLKPRDAPRLHCTECDWSSDVDRSTDLLRHAQGTHGRRPSALERTPRHQ